MTLQCVLTEICPRCVLWQVSYTTGMHSWRPFFLKTLCFSRDRLVRYGITFALFAPLPFVTVCPLTRTVCILSRSEASAANLRRSYASLIGSDNPHWLNAPQKGMSYLAMDFSLCENLLRESRCGWGKDATKPLGRVIALCSFQSFNNSGCRREGKNSTALILEVLFENNWRWRTQGRNWLILEKRLLNRSSSSSKTDNSVHPARTAVASMHCFWFIVINLHLWNNFMSPIHPLFPPV